MIFGDMSLTHLYGSVIGILYALIFALLCRGFKSPVLRCVYICIGVFPSYWLFGIYGLLGGLLALLQKPVFFGESNFNKIRFWALFVVSVICMLFFPMLCHRWHWADTIYPFPHMIGLPKGIFENLRLSYRGYVLLPGLLIAFAGIAVLRSFFANKRGPSRPSANEPREHITIRTAVLNALLITAACFATCFYSHAGREFRITARMCRLVDAQDWEGVLNIRYDNPQPVWPIILFRQLALFKLDRLADEAFAWPVKSRPHDDLKRISSRRVFGDRMLFEFGLVNMGYRSALSQYVAKGPPNVANLKTLVLCSMANGEKELARKYLRQLKYSWFHRAWAESHMEYLDRHATATGANDDLPEALRAIDDRLTKIRKLMPSEDEATQGSDLPLILLWGFSRKQLDTADPTVQKMYMIQAILYLETSLFVRFFEQWYPKQEKKEIPAHFQEALLLAADLDQIEGITDRYPFSQKIIENYQIFKKQLEYMQKTGTQPVVDAALFDELKRTCWFYHYTPDETEIY